MAVPVVTQPTSPRQIAKSVAIPTLSISASNTPTSYAAAPLPTGISINTGTGAITGTPTAAGIVTTSITATNGDGTSAAVSLVWLVEDSPDGIGAWQHLELDLDAVTREVTRPLIETGEDGIVCRLLTRDRIRLLVGVKKYSTLIDLKPASEVVSVKFLVKEFEPDRQLTLAGGTPTEVGSGTSARFGIDLAVTREDWAALADYAGDDRASIVAPAEIEIEVGSPTPSRITSKPFLVEVVRDFFGDDLYASASASASPSPSASASASVSASMSASPSPSPSPSASFSFTPSPWPSASPSPSPSPSPCPSPPPP